MELNDGALGKSNLFDLEGRTLRFVPERGAYRVEKLPLDWDGDFGQESTAPQVELHRFKFPFSGSEWSAFSVGVNGSLRFGPAQGGRAGAGSPGSGGIVIGRFDELQQAARALINTVPAICVFFKPRMSGSRFVKELADRVVVTWTLTEPAGGIQDFTWFPTVNRFQVVLRRDGVVQMSYERLSAKDGIVGLYPLIAPSPGRVLATLKGGAADVEAVEISVIDPFLRVMLKCSDAALVEDGAAFRVTFESNRVEISWSLRRGRGGRFFAFGAGVSPAVEVNGNAVSIRGVLPPEYRPDERMTVRVEMQKPGSQDYVSAGAGEVTLSGMSRPEVHFGNVKRQDGPFRIVYESFHYGSSPTSRDLSCTVIKALGDKFDFLAYYSDFRIDNPEAGTSSNGPLGGHVTGIGQVEHALASYCSEGRLQWSFIQPVYSRSNQMQEYPPEGFVDSNPHNIGAYERQLGERAPEGRMLPYNYAISQIAHEMGHRWSAFVGAKVNGEVIPLGPTHWARGLQAPVAFPYQRPTEASAMGGGVWQDNFDSTYTQLDDDYYVPATGWSYLDLYLMGLISPAEVPDFFLLRNLVAAGRDGNGHPIFKADRTKITIQDVIASEGPRTPDVYHSQRKFNTGIVVIVEHGANPSQELLQRAGGIREQWMRYWAITTGGRAAMTASPR